MATTRTLAIVKPDAVRAKRTGVILERIEAADFSIVVMKQLRLTLEQAQGFYAVHRGKSFFESLTAFMSSGPIVAICLERENAILAFRELIGATDPAKAAPGTIRKLYGTDVGHNAMHGSDAPETAAFEIAYFFGGYELAPLV
jgi:nucleoside-diphosphate kinase